MSEKLKIEYQEIGIKTVIDYFVKGYDSKKVVSHDYFLDPKKEVLIFKLYIEEKP